MGDRQDLVFVVNGHNLWATHMKEGLDDPIVVDQEMWLDLVAQVNLKCTCALLYICKYLIHLSVFTRIMNALLVNILC